MERLNARWNDLMLPRGGRPRNVPLEQKQNIKIISTVPEEHFVGGRRAVEKGIP